MKKVEEKLKYLYTMTANYPNQSPRLILEEKNVIMSNKFTLISLDRKLEGRKWGGARDSVQHKRKNEVWLRDLMESRKEIVTFESGLQ